jgi:hypothetical protein
MQNMQQDPLAGMAAGVGLKVNSPQAEQKLRAMAGVIEQQAGAAAVQNTLNPDAIEKSYQQRKQALFTR